MLFLYLFHRITNYAFAYFPYGSLDVEEGEVMTLVSAPQGMQVPLIPPLPRVDRLTKREAAFQPQHWGGVNAKVARTC